MYCINALVAQLSKLLVSKTPIVLSMIYKMLAPDQFQQKLELASKRWTILCLSILRLPGCFSIIWVIDLHHPAGAKPCFKGRFVMKIISPSISTFWSGSPPFFDLISHAVLHHKWLPCSDPNVLWRVMWMHSPSTSYTINEVLSQHIKRYLFSAYQIALKYLWHNQLNKHLVCFWEYVWQVILSKKLPLTMSSAAWLRPK